MIISELTYVNEMTLTIGLALATIGTFLGGIWANESWGRYWGWDAKETWALVIVLTYAIILHFRLIPGLNLITSSLTTIKFVQEPLKRINKLETQQNQKWKGINTTMRKQ